MVDTVSCDATDDMTGHGKATGGGLERRENGKEGTTRGDGNWEALRLWTQQTKGRTRRVTKM